MKLTELTDLQHLSIENNLSWSIEWLDRMRIIFSLPNLLQLNRTDVTEDQRRSAADSFKQKNMVQLERRLQQREELFRHAEQRRIKLEEDLRQQSASVSQLNQGLSRNRQENQQLRGQVCHRNQQLRRKSVELMKICQKNCLLEQELAFFKLDQKYAKLRNPPDLQQTNNNNISNRSMVEDLPSLVSETTVSDDIQDSPYLGRCALIGQCGISRCCDDDKVDNVADVAGHQLQSSTSAVGPHLHLPTDVRSHTSSSCELEDPGGSERSDWREELCFQLDYLAHLQDNIGRQCEDYLHLLQQISSTNHKVDSRHHQLADRLDSMEQQMEEVDQLMERITAGLEDLILHQIDQQSSPHTLETVRIGLRQLIGCSLMPSFKWSCAVLRLHLDWTCGRLFRGSSNVKVGAEQEDAASLLMICIQHVDRSTNVQQALKGLVTLLDQHNSRQKPEISANQRLVQRLIASLNFRLDADLAGSLSGLECADSPAESAPPLSDHGHYVNEMSRIRDQLEQLHVNLVRRGAGSSQSKISGDFGPLPMRTLTRSMSMNQHNCLHSASSSDTLSFRARELIDSGNHSMSMDYFDRELNKTIHELHQCQLSITDLQHRLDSDSGRGDDSHTLERADLELILHKQSQEVIRLNQFLHQLSTACPPDHHNHRHNPDLANHNYRHQMSRAPLSSQVSSPFSISESMASGRCLAFNADVCASECQDMDRFRALRSSLQTRQDNDVQQSTNDLRDQLRSRHDPAASLCFTQPQTSYHQSKMPAHMQGERIQLDRLLNCRRVELATLESQISATRLAHDNFLESVKLQQTSEKARLEELEQRFSDLNQRLEDLSNRRTSINDEIQCNINRLEESRTSIVDLHNQISGLKSQVADLQQQTTDLEATKHHLQQTVANKQELISQLDAELSAKLVDARSPTVGCQQNSMIDHCSPSNDPPSHQLISPDCHQTPDQLVAALKMFRAQLQVERSSQALLQSHQQACFNRRLAEAVQCVQVRCAAQLQVCKSAVQQQAEINRRQAEELRAARLDAAALRRQIGWFSLLLETASGLVAAQESGGDPCSDVSLFSLFSQRIAQLNTRDAEPQLDAFRSANHSGNSDKHLDIYEEEKESALEESTLRIDQSDNVFPADLLLDSEINGGPNQCDGSQSECHIYGDNESSRPIRPPEKTSKLCSDDDGLTALLECGNSEDSDRMSLDNDLNVYDEAARSSIDRELLSPSPRLQLPSIVACVGTPPLCQIPLLAT